MKHHWRSKRISEFCEVTSSRRTYAKDHVTAGVPFYRSKEIIEKYNGQQHLTTELFITEEWYNTIKSKFGVPAVGDVLITSRGSLGVPFVVRTTTPFYFADGNLTWFKNLRGLDSKYLYYWFLSPEGKAELKKCTIGSSQQAYTIVLLKDMEICLPPLPTQRKIAGVLSAYDDLIENNTRRIAILEEMAQAIYREWFVNFRFPGHEKVKLINSPLGKTPEGWTLTDIGHFEREGLVDLQTGPFGTQLKASQYTESGTPVINVRNIGYGTVRSDKLEFLSDAMVERLSVHVLKVGDIVFGRKGAVDRHLLVTRIEDGWMQGSDCLRLRSLCDEVSPYILTFAFREQRHHEWMLRQCSHGATMASLNQDVIRRIPYVVASPQVRNEFIEISSSIVQKVSVLQQQCENPRQTRDLLLPKLISGQLDVEELDIDTGEPLVEAEA